MNYDKIINNLYVGNDIPTSSFFHLIVNCTHEIPFSNFCNIRVRIPVNNHSEDCEKLVKLIIQTNVLEKIHRCILHHEKVLVHCFGNDNQRSFAIIVCYMIYYYNYNPIEAIQFIVKQNRNFIVFLHNIQFMASIHMYYQYIQQKHLYLKN